jgi:hypothetical protein
MVASDPALMSTVVQVIPDAFFASGLEDQPRMLPLLLRWSYLLFALRGKAATVSVHDFVVNTFGLYTLGAFGCRLP